MEGNHLKVKCFLAAGHRMIMGNNFNFRDGNSLFVYNEGVKKLTYWRYFFMDVLKVSAKSNPNSVAGALAGVVREAGGAEIQAIGAGALNQAVKAVAISRGFLAPAGIELVCIPAFTDIFIDGEERTAIRLVVEPRQTRAYAM